MDSIPAMVQQLSDRLLDVENVYASKVRHVSDLWFADASRSTGKRWRRGRTANVDAVVEEWQIAAGLFASAADQEGCEFLGVTMTLAWAGLVDECKEVEAKLGQKRVGIAGTALNGVRKEAMQRAAIGELQKVSADAVAYFRGSVAEEVRRSAVDGQAARQMTRSVEALWTPMRDWIVSDARRVEFEMVNGVRGDAIDRLSRMAG